MTKNDKMNQIEEAMSLIEEAQTLIDEVVEGMPCESHYDAYGKYGFTQLLGNGNPYDGSLLKIYEDLDEEEECEEFALVNGEGVTLHIAKYEGKWQEVEALTQDGSEHQVNEFRNFGSKTYMSYLSPNEIRGMISIDYPEYEWEVK